MTSTPLNQCRNEIFNIPSILFVSIVELQATAQASGEFSSAYAVGLFEPSVHGQEHL